MRTRVLRLLAASLCTFSLFAQRPAAQWPTYGGDAGGSRYSSSAQIDRANVSKLGIAWEFHARTGVNGTSSAPLEGALETTPILFKGSLYLTSPIDQVYAIDPATGVRRWSYDPLIDRSGRNLGIVTSRGVASWSGTGKPSPRSRQSALPCIDRIFVGTLDARLIALDAATGKPCEDFGDRGTVDLNRNVDYRQGDDYAVTSPPTVLGDVVVVGSGIEDNLRVDVERGDVRGFDVRTGKLLWTWQPLPWADRQALRTGAGNTWSVIAADTEHGLLYLPTASPSPDYYGGTRPGDNRDADSIVALDAKTGKKVWAFQLVHHNIWDYDVAAEPLLFTFRGATPAVAVATKMGLVFVFNRLTGEPLYPIHERPVPASDVPGEQVSPTQPVPDLPPLSPTVLDLSRPLGLTSADDHDCREQLKRLRNEGLYTPVSLHGGSLLFPSNVGGVNWGSMALDPATGILYADTNRIPYTVRLERRPSVHARTERTVVLLCLLCAVLLAVALAFRWKGRAGAWAAVGIFCLAGIAAVPQRHALNAHLRTLFGGVAEEPISSHFEKEVGADTGTPYMLIREPLQANSHSCGPTPWGTVSALNLNTGKPAWETPLGTVIPGGHTGTRNVGGPIVTAGGLVFTAASREPYLRAFDAATGEELWKGRLPHPGQATPMTYTLHGTQYVVIAAGGHYAFGTSQGDSIVAFALPHAEKR